MLVSVTPVFGATVGPPDQIGETLLRKVVRAGLGRKTKVHAVSDGASWIADQVSEQFGLHGHFVVDFHHVGDYLTAAAKTIASAAISNTMPCSTGAITTAIALCASGCR